VSSLGVNSSSVKDIAQAKSTGEHSQLSIVVNTSRLLTFILGATAAAGIALFSSEVAKSLLGSASYQIEIVWCAASVCLTSISCALRAQLQGLQQLRRLAVYGMLVSVFSAAVLIASCFCCGLNAVAPALAFASASEAFLLFLATRRITPRFAIVPWKLFLTQSAVFVRLGVSLVSALFISYGVTYATRALINQELGLEQTGYYLAAVALSTKAVGFLVDSIRVDLFPKLAAAAQDDVHSSQLLNGQIELCLLLATPAIVATAALSPLLLQLFFSGEFIAAAPVLTLLCLATSFKMISSPLSYIRIAKGQSLLYFLTEGVVAVLQLALTLVLIGDFGLYGVALAVVLAAAVQACIFVYTTRILINYRFPKKLRSLLCLSLGSVFLVVAINGLFTDLLVAFTGSALSLALALLNLRRLTQRLGRDHKLTVQLLKLPYVRLLIAL